MALFSKAFEDCYSVANYLKKEYKVTDTDEIVSALIYMTGQKVRQENGGTLSELDKTTIVSDIEMFRDELDGKCIHFFIEDPHLKQFLLETEIKDFNFYHNLEELSHDYPHALGFGVTDNTTPEEKESMKEYGNKRLTFCLHFINEVDAPRYILFYNTEHENHAILSSVLYRSADKEKDFDFVPFFDPSNARKAVSLNKLNRLGINFLYYIQAFPEVVKDGIPKGYKVTEGFKNKRKKVGLCDKIVIDDSEKRMVTPHFRRGHFRFLGSDWYKKMRGKTIFVEATVVNSKNNKTVEEIA